MTRAGDPLVECVPNVSEGRDAAVIDALATVISATPDVSLLHTDANADAHRTVFTFAGAPESVADAAIALGQAVARYVDMRWHHGAHPRLGALDVCPFVPLRDTTMARCAGLARRVASTLAHDLRVPTFLYEHAATRPGYRSLADLRRGEYEGLPGRLSQSGHLPDFGPATRSERLGAFAVGARPLLIAWNVSLDTADVEIARLIAGRVRTSGRVVRLASGERQHLPGRLAAVRAVGWGMPGYGVAQVSMNLLDYRQTPLHAAWSAVQEEAATLGARVTGSELVGLVPEEALVSAGRTALGQAHADAYSDGSPDAADEMMAAAVEALGLDHLGPFVIDERVIERRLRRGGWG